MRLKGEAVLVTGGGSGIAPGRFAEAEEIASAVLFLASDQARCVKAAEIVIEGGFTGAPMGGPVFHRRTDAEPSRLTTRG